MNRYLQEGFDPKALKVADLRRILLENNINFNSKANKKDLLKLYADFLQPIIPDLRKDETKEVVDLSNYPNSDLDSDDGSSSISDLNSTSGSNHNTHSKSNATSKSNTTSRSSSNETINNTSTTTTTTTTTNNVSANNKDKDNDDDDDVNVSNSSIDSFLNMLEPSTYNTPQKQSKKRKISETIDLTSSDSDGSNVTPIIKKIAKKSPSKISPSKSIDSTEFNITDSDSDKEIISNSDNLTVNGSNKENINDNSIDNTKGSEPKRKDDFNFSIKRKTLSPDIAKLNISPAFAQQLNMALDDESSTESNDENDNDEIDNANNVSDDNSNDDNSNDDDMNDIKHEMEQNTIKSDPTFHTMKQTFRDSPTFFMGNNNEIKKESSIQDNLIHSACSNDTILTPDLPTEQDVKDSEDRADLVALDIELNEPHNDNMEINNNTNDNEVTERSQDSKNDVFDTVNDMLLEKEPQNTDNLLHDNSEKKEMIDYGIRPQKTLSQYLKAIFGYLIKLSAVCLVLISILFTVWYYQQRIAIGYCNHEIELPKLHERYPHVKFLPYVDSILDDFKPNCLPCPSNTICFPSMEIKCDSQYRLEKPFFNINNTIPFFDKCVEDNKRNELINEIVAKSLEFLRIKNAQLDCGNNDDDTESGLSELELYNIFNESKNSNLIDDSVLNEIWDSVINILRDKPDITYRQVSNFLTLIFNFLYKMFKMKRSLYYTFFFFLSFNLF